MKKAFLFYIGALLCIRSFAQNKEVTPVNDSIMITIMMRHHQDKSIAELREIRENNGFLELFPPASAKIMSWHLLMGIGHVVTLKLPASQLQSLNGSVERSVWGAFSTEFYATYDLYPAMMRDKERWMKKKAEQENASQ